ncbi:hypothetical protein DPX16_21546 [Anabarilius grahami]|uniref:Uncharacterized protein n=1 Tax=Anabarilius grahami TaxID=495550 RepID=A0A3N0XUQ6_ANAGA|nr:hypothetical protein DPX16_21546 [Anabarilius grahami]
MPEGSSSAEPSASEGVSLPPDAARETSSSAGAPNEKSISPVGEPPNSPGSSTRGTERAGEWKVRKYVPGRFTSIAAPRSPSPLDAEYSYPEVEGTGRGATEDALRLFFERRYESRNVPMDMLSQ